MAAASIFSSQLQQTYLCSKCFVPLLYAAAILLQPMARNVDVSPKILNCGTPLSNHIFIVNSDSLIVMKRIP